MKVETREAAHDSRCAICDMAISQGEMIALLEDDWEWVHRECAEKERGWIEEEDAW